jgi:hypothetical protein
MIGGEDAPKCLERGPDCRGPVEHRMPLSGTGVPFPRCEHHWSKRLDRHQEEQERDARARSVDYLYAGERYEDE